MAVPAPPAPPPASLAPPSPQVPLPVIIQWPYIVTLALIQQRRRHHQRFEDSTRHNPLWTRIANHIQRNYNYQVTATQCQVKWYALKQGYENSRRLLQGNPNGHTIRSPNTYDRRFYNEMGDEFWLQTGNYLL